LLLLGLPDFLARRVMGRKRRECPSRRTRSDSVMMGMMIDEELQTSPEVFPTLPHANCQPFYLI
jgi:hypothetical protein